MLMASRLEVKPQSNASVRGDDTLTPCNKSQADSLSGSTNDQGGLADSLIPGWDSRVSETETGTPGSGLSQTKLV